MRDKKVQDSEDSLLIDVTYLVYLKERDEPVNFNATFEFHKNNIREGREVEDVMMMATNHLLSTIDVVSEHRFILSDVNFTKGIFLTEQIQAVSILSPSEETVLKAMEA